VLQPTENLLQKRAQPFERNAFVSALELAASCGANRRALTESVLVFLQAFYVEYFKVPKDKENVYSDEALEEYRASLRGIQQIATKFPVLIQGIAQKFMDIIRKSAGLSYSLTQYTLLRDEAIETMCQILKVQKEAEGIHLVKWVLTQLYAVFDKKYIKVMSEKTLTEKSTSGDKKAKRGSAQTTPAEKLKLEKMKANESMLANIVITIGKITQTLNDPKVTELILAQLIRYRNSITLVVILIT
jgi:hypothetical protein